MILTTLLSALAALLVPDHVSCTRDVFVNELDLMLTKQTTTTLTDTPVSSTTTFDKAPTRTLTRRPPCQCVPYYMCGGFNNHVHVVNWTTKAEEEQNTRPIHSGCQESVEVCCQQVTPVDEVPALTSRAPGGCGYRNPGGVDPHFRGNGNDAEFGEFPWVVAILNQRSGEYGGAGGLIHSQVVVTAAHIASKFEKIYVRAGEWDTQTTNERLKSQERPVDNVILHQDFHPKRLSNDIALLYLKTPFDIAPHINILCLPEQNEYFDSHKGCYANGWGKNKFGEKGRYATILKKVELDMVPFSQCNELLRGTRLGARFKLHESLVCAGGEKGRDTCQGDGGGPLACPGADGRYKLSGLVAWGISCGEDNVPAVYVRVAKFVDWAKEVMGSWGLAN